MINIEKGRYWDLPWSLVSGCTPCSPGCDHCWSAAMTHRFKERLVKQTGVPLIDASGNFTGCIATHPERLSIPLKRRKPTVYAVWNDLFHEDVPDIFVEQVYDTIMAGSKNTHLILTKRPRRMLDIVKICHLPNIWHGLTVCNQQEADEKIPVFLQVPGKKFLSLEPMLSHIETPFLKYHLDEYGNWREGGKINAVLLGGETGPGARPMHPDWVRRVRDDCAAAGVPFFFKQIGEWVFAINDATRALSINGNLTKIKRLEDCRGEWPCKRIGRKKAGRLLDGRTHDDLAWAVK